MNVEDLMLSGTLSLTGCTVTIEFDKRVNAERMYLLLEELPAIAAALQACTRDPASLSGLSERDRTLLIRFVDPEKWPVK